MTLRLRPTAFLVLLGMLVLSEVALVRSQSGYPWIHFFQNPHRTEIHRVFGDNEGNVIVATGDWNERYTLPSGTRVYYYSSTGVYRVNCDDINTLASPGLTFVVDAAPDGDGRIWVIYGRGDDFYKHDASCQYAGVLPGGPMDRVWTGPHYGYRPWFYPLHDSVSDTKVGLIGPGPISEVPELTSTISKSASRPSSSWVNVASLRSSISVSSLPSGS